jgi:guanylate kinase
MSDQILILNGKTGAGKSYLSNKLIENNDKFAEILSFTTRSPREGEVDGQDYRFVTSEYIEKALKRGEVFESAKVLDNYYGILKKDLSNLVDLGKLPIFVCDYQGTLTALKKSADMGLKPVTVFIDGADQDLVVRILERYNKDLTKKDCDVLSSRLSTFHTEERLWSDSIHYNIKIHESTAENLQENISLIESALDENLPLSTENKLPNESFIDIKEELKTNYFQFLEANKSNLDIPKAAKLINTSTENYLNKIGADTIYNAPKKTEESNVSLSI